MAGVIGAAALLTSCVSTAVTARPSAPATFAVPVPASSFWEALDAFDFERARQLAADREQQDLALAVETALSGNDEAVAAARRSWESTHDPMSRHRMREWLEGLLLSGSRWQELLDVYAQDPVAIEPAKDLRPFVSVYVTAPREEYQFASGEDTIPMPLNAAGLPLADVEINGRRKRLVIDTGASITTVSTDVARESGMVVGGNFGQAGTATRRTVAIRGAVIDQLRVGGLMIRNHPAGVIESSALRIRLGFVTVSKIDGVLGWNAIREMTLQMNYRDRRAVISAPRKQGAGSPRNLFDIAEPIVRVTDEHGQRLVFKLDTGAAVSSLDERALTKIIGTAAHRKMKVISGVGGSERYKSAVIPQLRLLVSDYSLDFTNLATLPEPKGSLLRRDGILGSDIAKGGSITIDAMNGRFQVERKD